MMEWINSEQGITLLRAAVLLAALLWLLSGGFRFGSGSKRKRKTGRDPDKDRRP